MSTDTQEIETQPESGTKPEPQHEWLQQLVGEWKTETEMAMGPGEPIQTFHGTESVKSLGGLWAMGEGKGPMPDGSEATTYYAIGWDVTLKEYRGCYFGSMSSHLWKYEGEMSEDQKTLTLNCVGPSFTKDGEMANYRDVIEIIDENYRTLTGHCEDDNGEWQQLMKMHIRRI